MIVGPQITPEMVSWIHDLILMTEPGLHGDQGWEKLEGALGRVDLIVEYDSLEDVFEIAAVYAMALACGHAFNDANKRTALVTALTYLDMQGITIPREPHLDDVMVDVTEHRLKYQELAQLLYSLWEISQG